MIDRFETFNAVVESQPVGLEGLDDPGGLGMNVFQEGWNRTNIPRKCDTRCIETEQFWGVVRCVVDWILMGWNSGILLKAE
jgi:hypothetical protein